MTATPSPATTPPTTSTPEAERPATAPVANDLFENLPVPALRTGADGRIWRVNPLAAAIFGNARALEGTSIGLVLPGLALDAAATGPIEWRGLVPAPEQRWVDVSAARVAASAGPSAPPDWLLVVRDATEAVARREFQDAVLALLAHELRTPLATLRGFAENLVDSIEGPINERQRDVLNRMIRTSQRSARLLETVLESARCRAGRAVLSIAECRLGDIVRDAAEAVSAAATEKGLTVHADVDPSLPAIRSDADRIEQVLLNLLTNAIKYTPRHGSVRLRASRLETGVAAIVEGLGNGAPFDASAFLQVTVEDTGVGIPAEQLDRIFDRFTSVRTATEPGLSSYGLGLFICRDIVEQLGGRLCIQSRRDEGTRVSVLVPVLTEVSQRSQTLSAPSEEAGR